MALPLLSVLLLLVPVIFVYGAVLWINRTKYGSNLRRRQLLSELKHPDDKKARIVGFFHPYCNAGGGGERVLWVAIKSIQETTPGVVSVVYSGDRGTSKEEIIAKVESRFAIELNPTTLHFVFLSRRKWVEDSQWPRFTLIGQSIGSIFLAYEALSTILPDLFIDTMGYAFTFPLASILGIPVGAYVHYPTISTTMLSRIEKREASYANSQTVSNSTALSQVKLIYYRIFMYLYSFSLRRASFVMTNSSWTKNHVDTILNHRDFLLSATLGLLLYPSTLFMSSYPTTQSAKLVYPSCDTKEMSKFLLEPRENVIISLAQFRPEKDHAMQLRSFHLLITKYPEYRQKKTSLVLIGGCRGDEDAKRVDGLKALAKELEIENEVTFLVNAPYSTVLSWLSRASIGLSTMVDEHFGINIVEFMAAGMIPVAHASGGPLLDIIVPFDGKPTGFHANTPESFAETLHRVLSMPHTETLAMRTRSRALAVQKFSEAEFVKGWEASGWRKWI